MNRKSSERFRKQSSHRIRKASESVPFFSAGELRIHSVWNFLWMRLWFIRFVRKLCTDEPRIHSDCNFRFIGFETFFWWVLDSFGFKLRIHSVWSKFYGFIRIENLFRNGSEWLAFTRIQTSDWLGELRTGSDWISIRSFRQGNSIRNRTESNCAVQKSKISIFKLVNFIWKKTESIWGIRKKSIFFDFPFWIEKKPNRTGCVIVM